MDQAEYALNVSGRILDFLEDYYNVSYPLSQMGLKLSTENEERAWPGDWGWGLAKVTHNMNKM